MNNKNNFSDINNTSFLRLIIIGIIIGTASVIPGLSGGIIAVSLGIYTAAINAIVNIRNSFLKSTKFLIPLGIGASVGVFIFGMIIEPLLSNFESYVIYLFIGLIIGSIPSFLKEATQSGFRLSFVAPALITFCLGVVFSSNIYEHFQASELNISTLLICGGILAFGMIIPGISSSFILIRMNVYEKLIYEFTHFNIPSVIWTGIGFITVLLLSIKFVNFALNKFRGYTYFAAFGFLVSSVVSAIPSISSVADAFINAALLFVGGISSYLLVKRF